MAKPRLIILIRHAQSEGNKNREIHQTIPDHRVKLTQDGWQQAYDAGRRLRKMLRADDTLHFFTSPYRRTRETTEGILATLTSDEAEPPPPLSSGTTSRMWQERADYGHFFYRIPNGESAADAYDRISGFNESLWRQFGEGDFASVCVLVLRSLRNINHCELLIMNKQESGKYVLENKLRTWSELRKERARKKGKEREKEKSDTGTPASKDTSELDKALSAESPVKPPRRWGGCLNGCSHKSFRLRSALADLVHRDGTSRRFFPGCSWLCHAANHKRYIHAIVQSRYPTPSSDTDSSEDDGARQRKQSSLGLKVATSRVAEMNVNGDGDSAPGSGKRDQSGMGRGTMANRLGDSPVSSSSGCYEEHHHHHQSEHNNENEHADDEREKGNDEDDADEMSDAEIDRAERGDRSIKGSVY
ncbi:histidine phosphatase superfamily [Diaporthe sp. PMI_573]|nr:histidine phosphatase superfamily [Diaporthaceae sp. PMI_573]